MALNEMAPEDGSMTDGDDNSSLLEKNSEEDSVIFIDPAGTRWEFPYESCKAWEDMAALVRQVFVECFIPSKLLQDFDKPNANNRNYSIERLEPRKATILQSHWQKLVKPGWVVTITFRGFGGDFLLGIIRQTKESREKNEVARAESKNPSVGEKDAASAESKALAHNAANIEDDSVSKLKSGLVARSYLTQYYRRDTGGSIPSLVRQVAHSDPHEMQRPSTTTYKYIPAVLEVSKKILLPALERKFRSYYDDDDENEKIDYRNIEGTGVSSYPLLRIYSQPLLNALRDIVGSINNAAKDPLVQSLERYETVETEIDFDRGMFLFPFRDLFHYKDDLIDYKNSTIGGRPFHSPEYNKECDEHIDILVEYLYEVPRIGLRNVEKSWSLEVPKIQFHAYWLLLKPGSTVLVRDGFGLNAYVVDSFTGGVYGNRQGAASQSYYIRIWNLEFDGKHLNRSERAITVPFFEGEREITSLPLFPPNYKKGGDLYQKELIKRGKHYVEIVTNGSFREFSGPSHFYGLKKYDHSRAVIDHKGQPWRTEMSEDDRLSAPIHYPCELSDELGSNNRIRGCECDRCQNLDFTDRAPSLLSFSEYEKIDLGAHTDLIDHQYLLCWSHVYGYMLKDRVWDLLEVDRIVAPVMQDNIIDNLVIDSSNKSMIKAICETYSNVEEKERLFFADFIKGKGEGQIMLLHGPPGTGKTLTAECVAESISRPLLSVTASDLGHEPEVIERNLLRFFRNATRWDAIVLLDEADVFLQKRSIHDLERNSVVSVFLRALDYFQGILFITTNRVGVFDEAFLSRIHLQIGYDPLDYEAQAKIWDIHFERLKSNRKQGGQEFKVDWQVKKYVKTSQELRELNWNGREIRNAFQTAVALASFEAKRDGDDIPTLTHDHIDAVATMSRNFKNYMKEALRASPEDLAAMSNMRADRFKPNQAKTDQVVVSQFRTR